MQVARMEMENSTTNNNKRSNRVVIIKRESKSREGVGEGEEKQGRFDDVRACVHSDYNTNCSNAPARRAQLVITPPHPLAEEAVPSHQQTKLYYPHPLQISFPPPNALQEMPLPSSTLLPHPCTASTISAFAAASSSSSSALSASHPHPPAAADVAAKKKKKYPRK